LHLAREHGYRPVEAHAMHMLGVLGAGDSLASQTASEASLRESLRLSQSLGLRPLAAATTGELARRLRAAGTAGILDLAKDRGAVAGRGVASSSI
jgi:hypothetical protein